MNSIPKQQPRRRAQAQLVATFGDDELDLYNTVRDYHEKTGIPVAVLVKQSLRIAFYDDDDLRKIFRAMRDFTAAARPVAPKAAA